MSLFIAHFIQCLNENKIYLIVLSNQIRTKKVGLLWHYSWSYNNNKWCPCAPDRIVSCHWQGNHYNCHIICGRSTEPSLGTYAVLQTARQTCDSKLPRWHQLCHIADSFVTRPLLRSFDFPFFIVDALSLSIRDLLRYDSSTTRSPPLLLCVTPVCTVIYKQCRDRTRNACLNI